jgi:hypothetical protein
MTNNTARPAPIECTSEAHFHAVAARLMLGRSRLSIVEVQHDNDCPVLHGGGGCACRPDLLLTDIATGVPTVLARWLPPAQLAGRA